MMFFLFVVQVVCATLYTIMTIINIERRNFPLATGCAALLSLSVFLGGYTFMNFIA